MQKVAVYLRKQYPGASPSSGDTSEHQAMSSGTVPQLASQSSTSTPALSATAANKAVQVGSEPLAPKDMDALLTLEISDPPPAAAAVHTSASAPASAAKGKPAAAPFAPAPIAPAVSVAPAPVAAPSAPAAPRRMTFFKGRAKTAAAAAPAANASAAPIAAGGKMSAPPAAGKGAAATAPGAMPARDIEVLAFDANIEVPTAQPAPPLVLPEADVLPFDVEISIPTAHPAPAAAAATPSVEIEVLDFEAELTLPPTPAPVAVAAPMQIPVARPATAAEVRAASTSSQPKLDVRSATSSQPKLDVRSGTFSQPKLDAPSTTSSQPRLDARVATASQPKLDAASITSSQAKLDARSTTTTSQPKLDTRATFTGTSPIATTASIPFTMPAPPVAKAPAKSDDAEVLLINDTGPVKKLEVAAPEVAAVELPAPSLPAPPPMSAEETATDLVLYTQELIKLRSSGRTRRYEVLARSQRDAGRDEVPTAFVAETARGREGAALDRLVVERLLQWLGTHGETIWDSEPASFSVNLSIGAIEDVTFPDQVAKWLEQYNVPAEHVGFEISEFACVQCRPQVQRFVEACEKLGCFLVIDNFTFDSNVVEFLGSKAMRHVKIDPKLTTAAMKDKLPQALVVAILQACKVLGVHCVSKRIDSQASLQWLTAVGCDFAQSFQLAKPAPIDSLVSGKQVHGLRV